MSAPKTQLINGLWNCTAAEYFEETEYVSNSDLKVFRDSIPRYHGLKITKTIKDTDSAAKRVGSAWHACLLQPDKVNDLFVQWPKGDGRNAAVQRAREAVSVEAGHKAEPAVRTARDGKTIILVEEWDLANRMADAARLHPEVAVILEMPGYFEQAVKVESPETGKIKARFDKLLATGHIVELKSTRHLSPDAWAYDAWKLGYHRQAAFYETVRDLAMPTQEAWLGLFVNIVTCSLEPYETFVRPCRQSAREIGREENRKLLEEMRERREKNDWSSRNKGHLEWDLPYFAYPKEQRQ